MATFTLLRATLVTALREEGEGLSKFGYDLMIEDAIEDACRSIRNEVRARNRRLVLLALQIKFGPLLAAAVERVQAADEPELDSWIDRIVSRARPRERLRGRLRRRLRRRPGVLRL